MLFNVVYREEYVYNIERWHRVVKGRAKYYYAILPFNYLPRMMVVQLILTVVFYVNALVQKKGVSQVLLRLTIAEWIFLDFNLHFYVIFGKFLQIYEDTNNAIESRTINTIALGTHSNLQGYIRYFSLVTGKVLKWVWSDITECKILVNATRRVNYTSKKQKRIKGLKFMNRQNDIDRIISKGIDYEQSVMFQEVGDLNNVTQYEIQTNYKMISVNTTIVDNNKQIDETNIDNDKDNNQSN